jgi:arylsulfatase A-like enzyme
VVPVGSWPLALTEAATDRRLAGSEGGDASVTRRTWIAIVGALVVASLTPIHSHADPSRGRAASSRPNILLLVSDDQAWSDFSRQLMPSVFADVVDQGMLFKRAYVNTSLCCPSRSQILTGLFEHHTGVDENTIPLDRPTFPEMLHDIGYRTMLAGKYLNSWPCDPRPEFDRWACTSTPPQSSYSLVDPFIEEDGSWTQFDGYQPDILANQVVDFIHSTPSDQPFFAMYTPTSPHLPADDPRYDSMPVTPPHGPAFDQNTLTTSSPLYARRPPLTPDDIASSDLRYTKMAHAVRSLDDAMGRILSSLGDRTRDTLVIYLSDNGFLYGEHRRFGKTDAYEPSVRVPMVIRFPALLDPTDASTSQALVSNVDIAPTIAELLHRPWGADGRSLVPLMTDATKSVRSAVLIEHCRGVSEGTPPCSGLSFFGHQTRASGFDGVVTSRYKFVRYDDGSRELFDLGKDPNELANLIGAPGSRAIVSDLKAQLAMLLAPRIDTTIVSGPSLDGSRVARFRYFSPSRFSTYRCRLTRDGSPEPWHACDGQSDAMGGLADGTYTFEVAGTDEFGQVDPTPASRTFTVKSSGPDVAIGTHPPAAQTASNVGFTFSSSVAGASFECRLSEIGGAPAPWATCDPSTRAAYFNLTDGVWSFEVRAQDPATQTWSDPPADRLVRIDSTGPAFVAASGPNNPTSSRDASFRFVPDEGVPGPTRCRLDGRPVVDCSQGAFSVKGLMKGVHVLRITAADALGNVAETDLPWTVDVGPPKVRLARGPVRFTAIPTAEFRLWSNTDPALFVCSLDHGPEMPCSANTKLGPLLDGPHRLTIWGLDAAMNRSAPTSYRWTVDTIPPGLLLSGTPEDGAVTADRTATFDIWQSEPARLFCSLDGAASAPCTTPVTYADLADGTHTFQVYAQDRAGNVSIAVTRSWTVDPNAP